MKQTSANLSHIYFGAIVNVSRTVWASESVVALAFGFVTHVNAFAILAMAAIELDERMSKC